MSVLLPQVGSKRLHHSFRFENRHVRFQHDGDVHENPFARLARADVGHLLNLRDNGAYIPWQLTPEIQQRFGRWGSMLMLTTPIAYLNSVPGDDFHPVNIQATGEENPIDREFPYAYWNAKELGQASGVSGVDWFCVDMYERGTYYMLASIGPDRVWQAQDVSLPFVGNKSYSSSNGINSKGDIFRFGP